MASGVVIRSMGRWSSRTALSAFGASSTLSRRFFGVALDPRRCPPRRVNDLGLEAALPLRGEGWRAVAGHWVARVSVGVQAGCRDALGPIGAARFGRWVMVTRTALPFLGDFWRRPRSPGGARHGASMTWDWKLRWPFGPKDGGQAGCRDCTRGDRVALASPPVGIVAPGVAIRSMG